MVVYFLLNKKKVSKDYGGFILEGNKVFIW